MVAESQRKQGDFKAILLAILVQLLADLVLSETRIRVALKTEDWLLLFYTEFGKYLPTFARFTRIIELLAQNHGQIRRHVYFLSHAGTPQPVRRDLVAHVDKRSAIENLRHLTSFRQREIVRDATGQIGNQSTRLEGMRIKEKWA